MIGRGPKCGWLFPFHISVPPREESLLILFFKSDFNNNRRLWHKRLGHPHAQKLLFMFKNGLIINKYLVSFQDVLFDCSSCKKGKSKTLPFPQHQEITTKCFDLINTYVWGIAQYVSHSHHKYFVTFIDDHSRFTWVYFLNAKSNAFNAFKKFLALIENQFAKSIKILR